MQHGLSWDDCRWMNLVVVNPSISPGMNPNAAATGKPEVSMVVECAANCDAVLLSACAACPAMFVNVLLVAFSIATHLVVQ